ncbi:Mitogen-activated protein kinase 3 [Porphyridium purpureum]|uniref:Mitogen-activated protein kinase 3 n=1 Tax=Porphyridium purpureum TaxID=35688 RepID=A0A5J4YNT6_PORPP|nr:Mitogen-activated protein kinase 3 [Porphyridium purpureum]|eukprot:POR0280..scf222_8
MHKARRPRDMGNNTQSCGAEDKAPRAPLPFAGAMSRKRTFMANGTEFCVDERYRFKHVLGSGTYGVVVACEDTRTGRNVAIKKILQPFEEEYATRNTLREIKLLHYLKHENVLSLLDLDEPQSVLEEEWLTDSDELGDEDDLSERESPQHGDEEETAQQRRQREAAGPGPSVSPDSEGRRCARGGARTARGTSISEWLPREDDAIYMVTELMDTSLRRVIRSDEQLSLAHTKFFMYQLFRALKYIHSANVLHRDIKPGNVLVNRDCDLKLCDFGLARYVDPASKAGNGASAQSPPFLTEYVVSRWYRAPEVLLSCPDYDAKIDVWGAGCIMAELLSRKPLFQGTSTPDQLHRIVRVLGSPSADDLEFVTVPSSRRFLEKMGYRDGVPLASLFPEDTAPDALDLLGKLLMFNPAKRYSAEQALNHPFMQEYHRMFAEPSAPAEVERGFCHDDEELDEAQMRRLIMDEIACFHPHPQFSHIPKLSSEVQYCDDSPVARGAVSVISPEAGVP